MEIQSPAASTARVDAWSMASVCAARMIFRRSRRSAMTPANGPIINEGLKSASAITPSQAPDWVSSQVSHPTAIRWIHKPTSDTELPLT